MWGNHTTTQRPAHDCITDAKMEAIHNSLQEVMAELKSLGEKINSIAVENAAQVERRTMNEARIDRIDHAIFGNGREGLTTRIDRLEQSKNHMVWIVGLAVGVLGSVIGSIAPLIAHLFHLFGK